jgi:acyl-CoA thioester hydrolase
VRLVMRQEVWRGEEVIFRAEVTAVCVTTDGIPTRLPAGLRRRVN